MPSRRTGIAACLVLAALAGALPAAGVEVSSSLEPPVVGLGEVATFSVEAHATGFDRLRFQPSFQVENFEIVAGPFQSESVNFVNGLLSRSFRLSWQLRPLAVGRARVKAVALHLQDQTLELPASEISVQKEPLAPAAPAAPGAPAGGGQDEGREPSDPFDRLFGRSPLRQLFAPRQPRTEAARVFVRAEVAPDHPYAGQETLYTLCLYTHDEITGINQASVPSFRGFWVRDIPQPQNLTSEMVDINGDRYARVVLLRKALFPRRPGVLAVEPIDVEVVARRLESSFFGNFDQPRQIRLRAPAVPVDVRPLPPAPPGWNGAVGRFTLAADLEPKDLRLGDAATLNVTLSGDGHLQGVPPPAVAAPPGLTILPPQQQGEDGLSGTTVRGRRAWSFPAVPRRLGRFRLVVPRIPYFDPQTGEYRMASAPAMELAVRPALVAAAAPPRPGPKGALVVRGAEPSGPRRWQIYLPWLLAASLGMALALTLARRRQRGAAVAFGAGPARLRAEDRLLAAEQETRPRPAATQIEEAWRDFLAERWEIPAGTPPPRWGDLLAERGANPQVTRELGLLADDLHYLRYAPQLSATAPLKDEALSRSRRLLRLLR